MNTPRFVLAAVAATLLSTASFASPPSADQVSVPAGVAQHQHERRIQALFDSPSEFMMFRMQMREATHGMARDQKKSYRKSEIQKIRGMNGQERASWLHGLQAKWDALPSDRKQRMTQRMDNWQSKHQGHGANKGQGYDQSDDQMGQSR